MSKISNAAVAVACAHVCFEAIGKIDYKLIADQIAPVFEKDWAENTAQTSLSTARSVIRKMTPEQKEAVVEYANELLVLADYDGEAITEATVEKGQAGRGGEDTLAAMKKKAGGGKVLKVGSIGFNKAMGL